MHKAIAAFAAGAIVATLIIGGHAALATPNDPCAPLVNTSGNSVSGYENYRYLDCRFDRQDAALKRIEAKLGTQPGSPSATPSKSPSSVTPTPTPSTSKSPTATPSKTPSPTGTTTPSPSPSTGGIIVLGRSFPDASTTGVPEAIKPSLTKYTGSCTITTANVAIDRKIIDCDQLRLLAPNAAITNSIINGTVFSDCCYLNGSYTLTDSEVHGPNAAATVVGEAKFKLLRVEVTGGSRSINCNDTCEVRDSFIHGQYDDTRGVDHESGIRQDNKATIVHNTITCDAKPYPPDSGCSAAISGYGDFGTVQHNTISNNLIDGGPAGTMSYCIYGGSTRGKPYPNAHHIVVTDNILRRGPSKKCGIYGPVSDFDSKAEGSRWVNNIYDDGVPVPPDR
jgi:hypothetical protein